MSALDMWSRRPDAADLCATKDLRFGTAYVKLSFPLAGTYEMTVADTEDAVARCV